MIGLLPIVRFLYFWATGDGDGHVQSLVLGGSLLVLGVVTGLLGVLADQIGTNRKLLEEALFALRRLEDERAAPPQDDLPDDTQAVAPARPLRIMR